MKCYQAKAEELSPQWYVIDATGMVVGRLAAQIAPILMGKHRPTYTPHIDTGDYVIVTNVDKVEFTGNKWQQKSYQRYSGHPGGQKDEVAWKLFKRHPERILELAIQRMMPKSKMGRHMMSKLKLVVGSTHAHQAQAPIPLEALSGRPAASGILLAPKPEPKAPKPRPTKAKPAGVVGHDHDAHDHDHDHEGHDHAGHDHAGHDHAGHDHDHAVHDHAVHDHAVHDHAVHDHAPAEAHAAHEHAKDQPVAETPATDAPAPETPATETPASE